MLLNILHEVDFVHNKLAIILLHKIVVVPQNAGRDAKLQSNIRKTIIHKIAEFGIDPSSPAGKVFKLTSQIILYLKNTPKSRNEKYLSDGKISF